MKAPRAPVSSTKPKGSQLRNINVKRVHVQRAVTWEISMRHGFAGRCKWGCVWTWWVQRTLTNHAVLSVSRWPRPWNSSQKQKAKATRTPKHCALLQFPLSIYYLIFKHSSRCPKDSTICTKYKIITARKSTWPFKHHVSCNHFVNTGKTFFSVRGIIFMCNISSKYEINTEHSTRQPTQTTSASAVLWTLFTLDTVLL